MPWQAGEFVNGLLHGQGVTRSECGERIEGEFVDGRAHGICKKFYANGRLMFKGRYVYGKWCGYGEKYSETGTTIYAGEYRRGRMHGRGKKYYESGELWRQGEYYNGKWTGMGTSYRKSGEPIRHHELGAWCASLRGHYLGETDDAGRAHGYGTVHYADTTTYVGQFVDGQPCGRGAMTRGGLTKVGEFADGEITGEYDLYTTCGVFLHRVAGS